MSCSRFVVRASYGAGALAMLCLLACSGMQSRPAALAQRPAVPVEGLAPAPTTAVRDGGPAPTAPTAPAAPTASGHANSFAADASADHGAPTEQASAVMPPCTCVTTEHKHRPKRKPRRRKRPPPPAPPPVVAAAPPAGVVSADVRSTNVPVMSILGKRVESPSGEDMGRVVDVLADDSGRVRVAIIDFGGFLGVGNRRIAVDWPLLRFEPTGPDPSLRLSLSMKELRAAPEYKDNPRPQILTQSPISAPAAAQPESKK